MTTRAEHLTTGRPPSPRPQSGRRPPAPRQHGSPGKVLDLQRTAGNRAVQALLAPAGRGPKVEAPRTTIPRVHVQRGDPTETPGTPGYELVGVSNLLGNMVDFKAAPLLTQAEALRPKYDEKLSDLAYMFERSWSLQDYVLKAASEKAEEENLIKGVLLGAAASVLVAAGAAALPAFAAFSAAWWTTQVGGAVVSSVGGTAAAGALASPTRFESSLPSTLMATARLKGLLAFERQLTDTLKGAFNLSRMYMRADFLLDQIINPARFGTTLAEAEREAAPLLAHKSELEDLWDQFTSIQNRLTSFETNLDAFQIPRQKTMLQAIWVHWIASLDMSDHDLLDNDEIEDHLFALGVLGSSGFLGVDTAEVFDTDKEKKAIRRARSRWPLMESNLSAP